jgi:hypothetical protein
MGILMYNIIDNKRFNMIEENTFYSSSSVVISGSGRYFRLWVKITSNGNQAGSIGPFPIVIPIS